MARTRVLVIGLNGLEITFAERLMAAGDMQALAELRRQAACFRLDQAPAQRTGLAADRIVVPLLRTGGHTGPHGMAYVASPGLEPGDRGVRSAFDVVPTIVELPGDRPPARISRKSLR